MPLPSSGKISSGDIQTEFGGSNPIQISEYYRGGGLVPNILVNTNIPQTGPIALSYFYNGTGSTGSGSTLTLFTIDYSSAYGDALTACNLGTNTVTRDLWHNGSSSNPNIGDTIYQDSSGLYTYNPANWYYIPSENSTIRITDLGVVIDKVTCFDSTPGNYDYVDLIVTNNSLDQNHGLWTRATYAEPYVWKNWLGQAMWKYDFFSFSNGTFSFLFERPNTYELSGNEQVFRMNTFGMAQSGHTNLEVPIYGIWRFGTGNYNINLTAVGYKYENTTATATTIATVNVNPPNSSIEPNNPYNALGDWLGTFDYNTSTGAGSWTTNTNDYFYKAAVATKGTKSSDANSTILKGDLFFEGSGTVIEKGFVYKTTDGNNIEIGQPGVTKVVVSGTANGPYEASISRTTDIYYKSYVIDSNGTNYSEDFLLDKIDGSGSANLPSKVEIVSLTLDASNITVNWDYIDIGESRGYVLLTSINEGDYALSPNGFISTTSETVPITTTDVEYSFIVRGINLETSAYVDSEPRSIFVNHNLLDLPDGIGGILP